MHLLVLEEMYQMVLKFGRHIREFVESRFKAVRAGHIAAQCIEIAMTCRFGM